MQGPSSSSLVSFQSILTSPPHSTRKAHSRAIHASVQVYDVSVLHNFCSRSCAADSQAYVSKLHTASLFLRKGGTLLPSVPIDSATALSAPAEDTEGGRGGGIDCGGACAMLEGARLAAETHANNAATARAARDSAIAAAQRAASSNSEGKPVELHRRGRTTTPAPVPKAESAVEANFLKRGASDIQPKTSHILMEASTPNMETSELKRETSDSNLQITGVNMETSDSKIEASDTAMESSPLKTVSTPSANAAHMSVLEVPAVASEAHTTKATRALKSAMKKSPSKVKRKNTVIVTGDGAFETSEASKGKSKLASGNQARILRGVIERSASALPPSTPMVSQGSDLIEGHAARAWETSLLKKAVVADVPSHPGPTSTHVRLDYSIPDALDKFADIEVS